MNYKATKSGFILGNYYKAGVAVPLQPEQAKFFMPPYADDVCEQAGSKALSTNTDKSLATASASKA